MTRTMPELVVFWSEEDEGYLAIYREFPGLSGFGDTREAATAELEIVYRVAVEVYQEEGWPLPAF